MSETCLYNLLPEEIVLNILAFLDGQSLYGKTCLNKLSLRLSNDIGLWESLLSPYHKHPIYSLINDEENLGPKEACRLILTQYYIDVKSFNSFYVKSDDRLLAYNNERQVIARLIIYHVLSQNIDIFNGNISLWLPGSKDKSSKLEIINLIKDYILANKQEKTNYASSHPDSKIYVIATLFVTFWIIEKEETLGDFIDILSQEVKALGIKYYAMSISTPAFQMKKRSYDSSINETTLEDLVFDSINPNILGFL